MSYLKRIIYNCKQATFLIDKKATSRLSFREMIELRIHLYGCSFCRIYKKQSRMINEMVQELFRSSMERDVKLDENFKNELQERIEAELNK
ncbi:hypothetical protein JN11_03591 [Mucilaginibacter frigoritolerans]|uniref:Uncharacterized protein n=1 Tax=Mucilaginibacter frigoritolerans TaxID=652788 RepID=A0A562TU45_9SPHI|nr:hypothetical protein [Mucilaginibacter frigoritolerans]TWI97131.1 hypothetical protein JN11_03591 [Mucilaginibacter frigoritolerans]